MAEVECDEGREVWAERCTSTLGISKTVQGLRLEAETRSRRSGNKFLHAIITSICAYRTMHRVQSTSECNHENNRGICFLILMHTGYLSGMYIVQIRRPHAKKANLFVISRQWLMPETPLVVHMCFYFGSNTRLFFGSKWNRCTCVFYPSTTV